MLCLSKDCHMRKIVEKHNVYAGQKYEMFYLVVVQMKRVDKL
jgi:hypothetical protein